MVTESFHIFSLLSVASPCDVELGIETLSRAFLGPLQLLT
jgi:hypothetical protein